MKVKYLLDENVDLEYRVQLLRHDPALTVWAVNDPGAPAKGTLDPDILRWCEEHDFILRNCTTEPFAVLKNRAYNQPQRLQ
jgi:Domain of unknown function (DUF5615)